MTVEFVCKQCEKDVLLDPSAEQEKACPHCQKKYPILLSSSMKDGKKVDRCVVCDRNRFYVQKDFNPRLGIAIFVLGVLFSYHTYLISLAVATAIDFILYQVLKTVTICYHCRAIYRDFEEDPDHRGFDHDLAMSLVQKEKNIEKKQTNAVGAA